MTLCSIIRNGVLTYILPSPYYTVPCIDLSSTSLQKAYPEVPGFPEALPCRSSLPPTAPSLAYHAKNHINHSDAFLSLLLPFEQRILVRVLKGSICIARSERPAAHLTLNLPLI